MTNKMRRYGIVAAGALPLVFTVPAFAADAIMEPAPQPPVAAPMEPQFSWSGVYGGASLGYGWANDSNAEVSQPGAGSSDRNFDDSDGVTGGVFAGYQQQNGSLVYGVEGDVTYGDHDQTRAALVTGSATQEIGVQGSLRGRLGYAMDRVLVYGTAGVAAADVETSATVGGETGGNDDARIGWTAGAGAEYAVTDQVFLRGEYRYTDYGDESFDVGTAGSANVDTNIHSGTVGVGFKF